MRGALVSLPTWGGPGPAYVLAGSLLYLVGTILMTMVFNVPRNDALAAADGSTPEGARRWADYLVPRTGWNHARTAAPLAAAALLILALCAAGRALP